MNVYETCPEFSSDRFLLRQTSMGDCADLLKVYSDPAAWPIFNGDNCAGDFRITRMEDMENMVRFWRMEYGMKYYVRWSVIDCSSGCAVGTIELFRREAKDFYGHRTGLLRLDLRSDFETSDAIRAILSLLLSDAWTLFDCGMIATKIPPCAIVRRETLQEMGFRASPEPLYGHDGTAYGDYFVLMQEHYR